LRAASLRQIHFLSEITFEPGDRVFGFLSHSSLRQLIRVNSSCLIIQSRI
jgi:hypothetical protein